MKGSDVKLVGKNKNVNEVDLEKVRKRDIRSATHGPPVKGMLPLRLLFLCVLAKATSEDEVLWTIEATVGHGDPSAPVSMPDEEEGVHDLETLATMELTLHDIHLDEDVIYSPGERWQNDEEADNIIVQQATKLAVDEQRNVRVLADDTNVFVLLLHHYQQQALKTQMIMESPIKKRAIIDIPATVEQFRDIIPAMFAGHALIGCDTVGSYFGIGKGTMLKMLKLNVRLPLDLIGNIEADLPDVMSQTTAFIATCYGQSKTTSLSEAD
ncbi:hypothetical protein GWK47_005844 [Chionoecetes opilio]|uniref:Uncharacterized protein n=1 Tax=Chionoecetes opilio TaxID=41210 RepID=A0A8J4Y7V1_CHIOP|nr:hypothetical protein GWK47_005844 [Chionoecetes opilio]